MLGRVIDTGQNAKWKSWIKRRRCTQDEDEFVNAVLDVPDRRRGVHPGFICSGYMLERRICGNV
jgi:hypothetical protein